MILSIIIPVYNVERYVGKTLNSISCQRDSLGDIEVIVVNDGTPDGSMDIVNSFVDQIPNLVIINQDNGGLSNARNTGLSHAHGEYVWFVDSDDWIETGSFDYVKERIQTDKYSVDVYCYQIREYREGAGVIGERPFPFNTPQFVTGDSFLCGQISFAPMQQFIIRRLFLATNEMVFIDGLVHEDIEFAPQMLMKANIVCVVPRVTYCYLRRNGDNITGSCVINEKRLNSLLFILDEYVKLEQEEKELKRIASIRRVQCIVIFALYGFSSIEQIKSNYLDAFNPRRVRQFKCIIRKSLNFKIVKKTDIFWSLLFVASPMLYKRISIKHANKKLL